MAQVAQGHCKDLYVSSLTFALHLATVHTGCASLSSGSATEGAGNFVVWIFWVLPA